MPNFTLNACIPTNLNTNTHTDLLQKLDAFEKKFYKNQLLKGCIVFFTAVLGVFLALSLTEYLGQFEEMGRTVLFYGFVLISLVVLYKWMVIPALKLYKLKQGISRYDAAKIIGKHFGEINDKVLNTLQLTETIKDNPDSDLLIAGIEQKTKELRVFDFGSVVNYSENKKYLKYAAIPIGVVVLILFVNARILTDASKRLILYNKHFEKQAPYDFVLLSKKLSTLEQEDFELQLTTKGSVVPKQLFIHFNNEKYLLNKENGVYRFNFKSPRKSVEFYFSDGEYSSKEYELSVLPKPLIGELILRLNYPKYTKKEPLELANIGDAIVPEGTVIYWEIKTKNSDTVRIEFPDSVIYSLKNTTELSKKAKHSFEYKIALKNAFVTAQANHYSISVIKDEAPNITFEEEKDSLSDNVRYFYGNVADDYGFSSLYFIYKIEHGEAKKQALPVSKSFTKDQFYHLWNINELGINAGEQIEYYFEVWDNDGVNGPKFTRTATKLYKAPTLEELEKMASQSNEVVKNSFEDAMKQAQKMQNELKNLQKNVLNKKSLNWQDQKQIEQFLNQQKQLEKNIEQLKQENTRKNNQQSEFKELNPELLEKQKQLEKLFDELMTDEMKKLYEELEKLLEQLDKDKVQDALEELYNKQEDLEKSLDRSLELFKQLEFDQKLESIMERLDNLSKEEEELSKQTEDKSKNTEDLKQKQSDIDEKFKQVKEDLDALEKLNEELENERQMENTDEQEKAVDEEMKNSQQELDKNNRKKASGAQKNASQKMQELKQQLAQMQQSQQQQQNQEDMASLRMLLENLIQFSFDQESVMQQMGQTPTSDPKYLELGREQKKLEDDAQIIKDSLNALAKRVFQIESFITKEMGNMTDNLQESIGNISERKTSFALQNQQLVMTSANNLALMLDEVLQQLQQQSMSQQPGSGSCNKPGGSGNSPSMQQMQQQLQQQLEQMKKQLEQGKQDGGKKPGGEKDGEGKGKNGMGSTPGGGNLSKELAKMAAQQEAIRKEIQRMAQELNKDGSGSGNGLNDAAKKLEEIEKDLVNKRITEQTIKRQQEIMTRLLEHEKAQREQEQDNKRESNEEKNQKYSNPTRYFEYKRKKQQEVELLKTIPPSLNDYYKNKANEFFNYYE
ncbi:MAG: DUF4175 family protein [Bacteroidia bacterium]